MRGWGDRPATVSPLPQLLGFKHERASERAGKRESLEDNFYFTFSVFFSPPGGKRDISTESQRPSRAWRGGKRQRLCSPHIATRKRFPKSFLKPVGAFRGSE